MSEPYRTRSNRGDLSAEEWLQWWHEDPEVAKQLWKEGRSKAPTSGATEAETLDTRDATIAYFSAIHGEHARHFGPNSPQALRAAEFLSGAIAGHVTLEMANSFSFSNREPILIEGGEVPQIIEQPTVESVNAVPLIVNQNQLDTGTTV